MYILDCTLRDGGYYNNWDFDSELVDDYLNAVASSGIDFVELGLRNFKQEKFLGPFAYTTDKYLESLTLPKGPKYGVMVDAKTILDSKLDVNNAIKTLFNKSKDSKIDLVRVAAHIKDVPKTNNIINALKDYGYIVGLNIMQAGHKDESLLKETVKSIAHNENIDALYFADSLGNMDANEVIRIVSIFKKEWHRDIGIHTHDNMDLGLSNTITALDNGVTWVDCTVRGMGRGAGNTQTEKLLSKLNTNKYAGKYKTTDIYELVLNRFNPMAKIYGWGSNILYYISAQNNIHPTFVQELLNDKKISYKEQISALNYLSNNSTSDSYSTKLYNESLNHENTETYLSGSTDIKDKFSDKEVLLIANGPSFKKYKNDITKLIDTNNFVVISINIFDQSSLFDYVAISHNSKHIEHENKFFKINNDLILPKNRFSKKELDVLKNNNIVDFSFYLGEENKFIKNGFISKYDLTFSFILGLLSQSRLKNIYLIGFDGYKNSSDPRHIEMLKLLDDSKDFLDAELISLTPTNYPIKSSSLYAFI